MIGTQEIVIIVIIALIVFGPQKMPEIGRQIGQMMREFRKMSGDVQNALNFDDDHNWYDNGYSKAYVAEPPGPQIEAPRHGETYAIFSPSPYGEGAADVVDGDHNPAFVSADEAQDYRNTDDTARGARSYAAPETTGADIENSATHKQTSDVAGTTNPVSVTGNGGVS